MGMPLMMCPKCERLHYVPGECPAPKQAVIPIAEKGSKPKSDSLGKVASHNPRNADRHKPGYQAQKQREYRARKKLAQEKK